MKASHSTQTRRLPADWPKPGPIDLVQHDPPHASSTIEWWYVNAHLKLKDGRDVGFFVSFFRKYAPEEEHPENDPYAHSLTWAISDCSQHAYYPSTWVDERAPRIGVTRLDEGKGPGDQYLNRAMREILERGEVPLPDRVFPGEVFVGQKGLDLDFSGQRLWKDDLGRYHIQLSDEIHHTGCDLVFELKKEPVRHGDDGVVYGAGGEDMFYYFVPRCKMEGTLTIGGTPIEVESGSCWYDHEFGRPPLEEQANDALTASSSNGQSGKEHSDVSWNWTAIQFEDGHEMTVYCLFDADSDENLGQYAIAIDQEGHSSRHQSLSFEGESSWRSIRTFRSYPKSWRLEVPEAGYDLRLECEYPDQEFITVISHPAFWEGKIRVRGTRFGKPVQGVGYIERSGFDKLATMDDFFGAVSEEVKNSVKNCLPRLPSPEQARDLIASKERAHYLDGVSLKTLGDYLISPIRDITDRGGKAWRSYAALVCCDVVQGDSRKFSQWLAMPEFLHVGSLIVDDVQDKSKVRRGGPTVHESYGDGIAINSGTAAYFLTQHLLQSKEISPAKRLELYDLYFEAMRAGHAGQALDIAGFAEYLPELAKTGKNQELLAAVLACHRLKTAAPAAALARMGAIAGGGTGEQVDAVGGFFEAIGVAFQIIDDVLNIRGFRGNLKSKGEDLRNGIVTYPVAHALGRLSCPDRNQLIAQLQSSQRDDVTVAAMAKVIEDCGALEACNQEAREVVERAWQVAEPLLVDSMAKVMLRAFGWYVIERHY